MKILYVLILTLLCTCVSAQIDSVYQVEYPYQKKIMDMGRVKGITVSLLQITKDGSKKKYCRISTESSTNGVYAGGSAHHALFTKEAAELLDEKLNALFVTAGSEKAKLYTEYVDLIKRPKGSLEISMFSAGNSAPFILQLDADKFLNRGRAQINANEIPKLVAALRKCLAML